MSQDPDTPPTPPEGPARLKRVEQIYFEVAALAPADRDDAIARLCQGDTALESEVRSLISSASRIGGFLDQPALGKGIDQLTRESARHEAPDELVGATIGAFTIEKRIASGGMGTVYLAARSDGQFDQQVALKVVKRGMDSEEILRRFKAERQTLAALDHPNIARLIDGGVTHDGRPFLVMEFVDGKPIDTYCDEKRLTVRERLKLFQDAARAVHHAHQNLVIHRDLKPSNILVTPQGVPKLLDFGIAKVLSGGTTADQHTSETERRLTPEYASPEQVDGGPVTTATDVYSLGVVLYELLTGSRPYHFGLKTHEEVRRVVCTLIPPAPSAAVTLGLSRLRATSGSLPAQPAPASAPDLPKTRGVSSTRLRGQLRGDLDNIVLMALRKEPQRRYSSAEQFSEDIGRFLSGMPVQARRDTLVYRASKFVRRHAAGVSLSVLAAALLTASTITLYRQADQLERQRDELLAANGRLEQTRRYLSTIISGADTDAQGPDARLATVLADAADALQKSPPADPLTRAAAEQAVGSALLSLGLTADARPLLESADRGFASLPEASDPRTDIATDLAVLLHFEGRHAEAESRFRTLLAEERARANGSPTQREGALLNNLGASLRLQGKFDEALTTQREAVRTRAAALGENSLAVAESRNNLASALFQKGELAPAIAEFEKALATRRSLLRPDHPLIVATESNLGLVLFRAGQTGRAIELLSHAASAWQAAYGPEHPGRVSALTSLSMALRQERRFDEAIAALERALDWQTSHLAAGSIQTIATQANIGITLAEKGDDDAAMKLLEPAVASLRAAPNPPARVIRSAMESLAALYEKRSDTDKARELRDAVKSLK